MATLRACNGEAKLLSVIFVAVAEIFLMPREDDPREGFPEPHDTFLKSINSML